MKPDYLAPLQGDLVQPWVQLVLESVPQLDGVALQLEVDVAQTNAAAHPQGGATSLGRTSGSTLDANTAAIDFQTLKGNAH